MPEGGIDGKVRTDREERGNQHTEREYRGEREASRTQDHREPDERQQGSRPAEVDELLASGVVDVASEEVPPAGGVHRHLVQRPAPGLGRADDHRLAHEDPGADRGGHGHSGTDEKTVGGHVYTCPPVPKAHGHIGRKERNCAEREMNLPRKWNRCEG